MTEEEKLFALSVEFAREGREGNSGFREQARKCRRFVMGDQWEAEDAEKLQRRGVLPITINHCLPIRDHLVGRQQQNPRDLTVLPAKGGNGVLAMLMSAMLKHAMSSSHGLFLKGEMFKDGVTLGRGFIGIDTDYSTDLVNGDIVVEQFSPFHVDCDPADMEYDLNITGRYVNTYRWEDREKLAANYPDSADELGAYDLDNTKTVMGGVKRAFARLFGMGGIEALETEESLVLDAEIYSQLQKYRLPVRRTWLKTWEQVSYWVDRQNRQVMRLVKKDEISRARQSAKYMPERFQVYEAVLPVLHKIVAAGSLKLEYVRDPFKFLEGFGWSFTRDGKPLIFDCPALFPVVPYYAYFENGATFGKIDNLIAPQQEENKRRTQWLRLLNSAAAAGWQWEETSLSKEMKDTLRNFGTRPDLSIEYRGAPPMKIQPLQVPDAYLKAGMLGAQDMKEISGVNDENLGYKTGSGMSGYAIERKQAEGLIANEIIFGNLSRSSVIFGTLLAQALRCGGYYGYEEVKALIDEEDLISGPVLKEALTRVGPPPQPPTPPNQQALQFAQQRFGPRGQELAAAVSMEYQKALEQFQQAQNLHQEKVRAAGEQVVMEGLRDIKVGRYGTKVVESPTTPTMRAATFEQMAALDKMRPGQLPFDELVEASDIPNKERIIEKLKVQNAGQMLPQG